MTFAQCLEMSRMRRLRYVHNSALPTVRYTVYLFHTSQQKTEQDCQGYKEKSSL